MEIHEREGFYIRNLSLKGLEEFHQLLEDNRYPMYRSTSDRKYKNSQGFNELQCYDYIRLDSGGFCGTHNVDKIILIEDFKKSLNIEPQYEIY